MTPAASEFGVRCERRTVASNGVAIIVVLVYPIPVYSVSIAIHAHTPEEVKERLEAFTQNSNTLAKAAANV